MRFVWAVVAFVLAAALIGAGIAQRTVFLGPDTATMRIQAEDPQPYTLIDAEVFRAHAGTQTLTVSGSETVYAAYGRTIDMEAWLSDAPYTRVTLDEAGVAQTEVVDAEGEFDGRAPAGSDLWLEEYTAESELSTRLQVPEGMSVLIASDGTQPAPDAVSIVWPISNATPWAGPLIVLGALMLVLGVVLYVLGVRHVRRSRGPRRKGPVLPPTEPLAVAGGRRRAAVAAAEPRKELPAGTPDDEAPSDAQPEDPADGADRPGRRGRRALLAIPALGLTTALLAGCSPDVWPQLGPTPTPSPTPTVLAPENQQAPALTETQAARIVAEVSETVAQADEARDADLAATRLDGIALEMRSVNYEVRGAAEDYPAPTAMPSGSIEILLPQAFDEWPRSAMLVVDPEGDDATPPTLMTIVQADPWSNYKVTTAASMEAAVEIPDLAPSWLGTALVPPDSSFLAVAPDELAAAYADILAQGDKSEFASLFDLDADTFRVALEEARASTLSSFQASGEETGEMVFEQAAGTTEPTALATLDSGAIVAVTVDTSIVTRPKAEDVAIKFGGNKGVVALVGEESSSTGVKETATNQLFFAVPAQGSSEPVRLLAYSSGLRSAELLD